MKNNRQTGSDYENLACNYLIKNGYEIIERNYRCKTSEIDIIAKKANWIIFIEVKYRSSREYGISLEAVNARKQMRIRKAAEIYLVTHYKRMDIPCRFDVIGIDGDKITHIKNAF
ncbi:MAG: YraN family protein [Eubacteriales bacterium]|nr:YraN family protein [Eubacteriales bacterium]